MLLLWIWKCCKSHVALCTWGFHVAECSFWCILYFKLSNPHLLDFSDYRKLIYKASNALTLEKYCSNRDLLRHFFGFFWDNFLWQFFWHFFWTLFSATTGWSTATVIFWIFLRGTKKLKNHKTQCFCQPYVWTFWDFDVSV